MCSRYACSLCINSSSDVSRIFACLTVSSFLLTSFLRLDGSSIEQGLFGFLPPMLVDCWFQICLMNEFAWYFASVVGQACNPGPGTDGVRLAIVNPTTVYGKVDRLLGLKADLLAVSEKLARLVLSKKIVLGISKMLTLNLSGVDRLPRRNRL